MLWPEVVTRYTLEDVKKEPSKVVGDNVAFTFKGGADSFIHEGTNKRCVGVLDQDDLALYDEAIAKLRSDYAAWLLNGGKSSDIGHMRDCPYSAAPNSPVVCD